MIGDEFLKKMKANDSSVWDDLMPVLRRIALGACRDLGITDALKEDVVQEVAIRVFTQWQTYTGKSALTTWMYKIARNYCLDELRKRKVRGDDRSQKINLSNDFSASPTPNPGYDDKLELMLCVQQVLADLDAERPVRRSSHRKIDVLLFWVEHSPTMQELALFLKTTAPAAKQRMYEIRKYLEKLCREFCGHDDCSLQYTGSNS